MKTTLAFIAQLAVSTSVLAWQPTKPIEAVVGFTPGSGNELIFRTIAAQVEKNTGAKFSVVHKPGAGNVIATEYVAKQPNDGYHIQIATVSALAGADKVQVPNKNYQLTDFTYLTLLASNPMAVLARVDDPINNFSGFLNAMKTQKVSFGDPGAAARMAFELLVSSAKIPQGPESVSRVEYRGPVNALNDVIGGHVRFALVPSLVALPNHLGNKVRIIALSSKEGSPMLPQVDTIPSHVPGFAFSLDVGLIAPKGTPNEVVEWYQREFTKASRDPSVQKTLENNLLMTNSSLQNSKAFEKFVYAEEKRFTPIVDSIIATQQKK
jgi:tripartite-type tricarboxylate transporter receptor subunit TctC